MNPYSHEQVFSVNTTSCIEHILPDVMHTDVAKKDNLSMPVVYDSEMACSPHPFTSSDNKAAELQKNRHVHASGEKQQAYPDSRQQDIQIARSTSLGGEGNHMQIGSLSEEVTENFPSSISELEVHLITSTYVLMRANFGSNFQDSHCISSDGRYTKPGKINKPFLQMQHWTETL